MKEVWVLLGHYERKRSELLGVYEHYERGNQGLDAAAIVGDYSEVDLRRVPINREKEYRRKKAKR